MFKLFKKKPKGKLPPQLLDMDENPINEGDEVLAHRYDLGRCTVELEGHHFYYVSQESEQRISYTKMIDAITENQKVKKVIEK